MPGWLGPLFDARTVVGFALGIAAAALAIWLQARVEHRHWLRQQRLEAFAAFVASLDAIVRPAQIWHYSWGKPQESSAQERFYDRMEALDFTGGRIHLLSEPPVNAAAIRALRQWTIAINRALRAHDEEGLANELNRVGEPYKEFIELARAELGQPKSFLRLQDLEDLEKDRATLKEEIRDAGC